jgi:hypothetical protein
MNLLENVNQVIDRGLQKSERNRHKCPYCGKDKEFIQVHLFGKARIVPLNCCEWEHEKENVWQDIYARG